MVFWGHFGVKKGVILDPLFGPPFDPLGHYELKRAIYQSNSTLNMPVPAKGQKGGQKGGPK